MRTLSGLRMFIQDCYKAYTYLRPPQTRPGEAGMAAWYRTVVDDIRRMVRRV